MTPGSPVFDDDLYLAIYLVKSQSGIDRIRSKAENDGFREQNNLHITVLSEKVFLPLLQESSPAKRTKIIQKIISLISHTDWKFKLEDIYYVAGLIPAARTGTRDEYRESYIRTVCMPGFNQFIENINNILESRIPLPFPHITLFTKGEGKNPKYYGIPINSKEEFQGLKSRQIR
jgi:hypothetical protein